MEYPFLYKQLVEASNAALLSGGIDSTKAQELAEAITEGFCRKNSEQVLRVPNLKRLRKKKRDEKIRQDSKTLSPVQLSKKHGISVRMVYLALADIKAGDV